MTTLPRPMWRARLRYARVHQPFTLALSIVLLIPAVAAIAFGDNVSAALTALGAGSVSRLIGVFLLIGCLMTLYSIVANKTLAAVVGMTITAMGCLLYSAGVVIGLLPIGGIVAGSGFLAIGIGFILRIATITQVATASYGGFTLPPADTGIPTLTAPPVVVLPPHPDAAAAVDSTEEPPGTDV
jgi:hypothetical protein